MRKPAQQMTCALLAAVTLVGGAACGGDGGGGPSGQSSSFVGIVSVDDGSATGSLAVTIQSGTLAPPAASRAASLLDPVNATGTLTLGGTTSLTGTYDPDTDILALTGGGYTFGGGFDGVDRLEGIWTGPGATSGTFVATAGTTGVAYCGTYTATDGSGDSGTFSIVVTGTTVRGEAYSSTDQVPIPLDGVISGTAITIYVPGTTTPLATGTRSGNTVSGTYDDGQGGVGTWTGTLCQ